MNYQESGQPVLNSSNSRALLSAVPYDDERSTLTRRLNEPYYAKCVHISEMGSALVTAPTMLAGLFYVWYKTAEAIVPVVSNVWNSLSPEVHTALLCSSPITASIALMGAIQLGFMEILPVAIAAARFDEHVTNVFHAITQTVFKPSHNTNVSKFIQCELGV